MEACGESASASRAKRQLTATSGSWPAERGRRDDRGDHPHGARQLPIGGVKEKVLAAHRAGTVVLPKLNGTGSASFRTSCATEMRIEFADRIEQVLDVLEPVAQPV